MNNQFRGRTIEEVVRKAVSGGYDCKADDERCRYLQSILADLKVSLAQDFAEMQQIERQVERLKDRLGEEATLDLIDDEAQNAFNRGEIINIIGLLLGTVPVFRAVRTGISAYRAGKRVATAIRDGAKIYDALLGGISGASAANIVLTPSTATQLDLTVREFERVRMKLMRSMDIVERHLQNMKDEGCMTIEV